MRLRRGSPQVLGAALMIDGFALLEHLLSSTLTIRGERGLVSTLAV